MRRGAALAVQSALLVLILACANPVWGSCGRGYFLQNGVCYECPDDAYCDGVHDGGVPLWVPKGFWIKNSVPYEVLACPNYVACTGGSELEACAPGYQGFVCAECVDGFFRSASYCHECWVSGELLGTILYSTIGGLIWLLFPCCFCLSVFFTSLVGFNVFPKMNAVLKAMWNKLSPLLIYFIFWAKLSQVTAVLLSVPVKKFSPALEWFYHLTMLCSLDMERWMQVSCLWGDFIGIIKQHVEFALFAGILAPLNLLVMVLQIYVAIEGESASPSLKMASARITHVTLFLVDLLYMFVCRVALFPWFCMALGSNTWVMFEYPDIQCYSDAYEWYASVPVSTVTLFTYCWALPLGILIVLLAVRHKRDVPLVASAFGFLYRKYEPGMYYFDVLMYLYRFLITFTFVVSFLGLKEMGFYILAVNLTFFLIFMRTTPYASRLHDIVEFNNFFCFLVTSVTIQIMTIKNLDTATEFAAVSLLYMTYIYAIVFMIYAIFSDLGFFNLLYKMMRPSPKRAARKTLSEWESFHKAATKAIILPGMSQRLHGMLERTKDMLEMHAAVVIENAAKSKNETTEGQVMKLNDEWDVEEFINQGRNESDGEDPMETPRSLTTPRSHYSPQVTPRDKDGGDKDAPAKEKAPFPTTVARMPSIKKGDSASAMKGIKKQASFQPGS